MLWFVPATCSSFPGVLHRCSCSLLCAALSVPAFHGLSLWRRWFEPYLASCFRQIYFNYADMNDRWIRIPGLAEAVSDAESYVWFCPTQLTCIVGPSAK